MLKSPLCRQQHRFYTCPHTPVCLQSQTFATCVSHLSPTGGIPARASSPPAPLQEGSSVVSMLWEVKKKPKKPKNHKKTQQPLMTAGRMASSCSLICPGCSRNPALHPGNPSLSRLPTHRADFLFAIMGKKKSLIIFFPPLITHITDFFFLPPTPYIYFIVPRHPLTATVTHGQRAPVAAAPSPGPTGLPAASLQTTKPR